MYPDPAYQPVPDSSDAVAELLAHAGYLADRGLAVGIHLALAMGRRPRVVTHEAHLPRSEAARASHAQSDRTVSTVSWAPDQPGPKKRPWISKAFLSIAGAGFEPATFGL